VVENSDVGAMLRERALRATDTSFSISDPSRPDNPLIWVNPAFEQMTGYSAAEVVGRNCRVLQGSDTDQPGVAALRAALAERRPHRVVVRNYRKDGTPFWNEVSVSPVLDRAGRLTHFVGVQADVTDRVEAQQERERLLAAERTARAEAERARAHLQLLSDISMLLSGTLDVEEALSRLTESLVPAVADWCSVHVLTGGGGGIMQPSGSAGESERHVVTYHRDPSARHAARRSEGLQAVLPTESSSILQVLRTGRSVLREHLDRDAVLRVLPAGDPRSVELVDHLDRLGLTSAVFVPLLARGTVLGVLILCASTDSYTADDLRLAEEIGRRAGTAIDNARLYRAEHAVSEAVQRSLLPCIPDIDGLDFAARYLPAVGASAVGGDWFDVLALPDGSAGVAIGDVMGHDLAAAAAMGQLRSVLRSYAWEGHPPPVVLDRLDRLVQALGMAQLATCLYGLIQLADAEPDEGAMAGYAFVRWANAGHLSPLLLDAAGKARLLVDPAAPPPPASRAPGGAGTGDGAGDGTGDGGEGSRSGGGPSRATAAADVGVLIGAGDPAVLPRPEHRLLVPPGGCLLLYTDGLVESRELDLDEGLERLRRTAERHDPAAGPERLVDLVVGEMLSDRRQDDDVAVLAVRVLPDRSHAGPPVRPRDAAAAPAGTTLAGTTPTTCPHTP
jgi:PAS domain S-box-containing protein